MTSSSTRRRLGTAATLVAAGAILAGPAAADPGSPPSGPSAEQLRARLAAGPAVSAAAGLSAAGTADTCPAGTTRGRTVAYQDFENGLPSYSQGWLIETGGAATGTWFAGSSAPTDDQTNHYLDLAPLQVASGTRTFLSFQVRGRSGDDNMGVVVNDESWTLLDLEPDWSPITLDVTTTTDDREGGALEIFFGHVLDPAVPNTFLAVDDLTVYQCSQPASGVRGDWTGGGTVDALGVSREGVLTMYPGRGNGTLAAGLRVGAGWGSTTWLGSPGDLDADRRTDLLARRSDGTLYRYSGRSEGVVAGKGVQVGTGWNAMTALATGGDLDGNGRPDILARRADGALCRYPITTTGAVSAGRQVGTGWNGITAFVVIGDTDGDARADVLGIDRAGGLFLYTASATGLNNGRRVGSGWAGLQLVSSPGDLDGDGRGDVLARSEAGDLYLYAGSSTGGLIAGKKIGSGWSGTVRLL